MTGQGHVVGGGWLLPDDEIDAVIADRGPPGDPGNNGASAYQIAVANGFVGDQLAWLASLVGPPGPHGIIKRIVSLRLTSNASGVITGTYSPVFAAVPNVSLCLLSTNNRDAVRLTASTASGFTAVVERRGQTLLSLLGVDILLASVSPVSGASVDATITEA